MKVSLYGSIPLAKDFCPKCKKVSFILNEKFNCCDLETNFSKVKRVKRESEMLDQRLSVDFKRKIIELQKWKCFLCGVSLSEPLWYIKKGHYRRLRINYDHFIPKAFCPNIETDNIYAMCNLCNSYKSSKMFDTRQEAVDWVIKAKERDGTLEVYSEAEVEVLKNEV